MKVSKVDRAADKMRAGAKLMQMHTVEGKKWFLVPGQEVPRDIAETLLARRDVYPQNDGLFPGVSQTYVLGLPREPDVPAFGGPV